ncbi:MAG: hypothetical protein ABJK11_02860 [Balneola sp.]
MKSSLVNMEEMRNRQRNESVYTSEGFIPQQYGIGLVLPFGLKSSLVNTDEMWNRQRNESVYTSEEFIP